jgi:23S rRNA (guanosine2251-2'-O)-methyltransferase
MRIFPSFFILTFTGEPIMNNSCADQTRQHTADTPSAPADRDVSVVSKECEKFNNHALLEGMTSISALIHGIRDGINTRSIQKIYFDREKQRSKSKELGFLRAVSGELGFEIELVDADMIDRMTIGSTHGGIIAACGERPLPSLEDGFENDATFSRKDGFFVMLEGMEDPYNFGYALRSLYAAGVDGIILTPRNWMGAAGVVARASAGASERLPMAICDAEQTAKWMHDRGYRVVCAGIRDSVSLYDANMKRPLLLVVGGEKRGISRAVLDRADQVVRIDYGREFRGSLSAASAATVLGFEVLRQNSLD